MPPPPAGEPHQEPPARGAARRAPWRWPRRAHPILVVDDDAEVRRVLVEALEAEGHPVLEAPNGAAALELVGRHRPALILLDLAMPVMDGRAFLAAYRRTPPPHAPVAVCTGHPRPAEQARRLGCADFLRKPFVLSEVLALAGAHADALAASTHWPAAPPDPAASRDPNTAP